MRCRDCALFSGKVLPNGSYICGLCTGTFIQSNEINSNICKYTLETITEEYASRKFWLDPYDYFSIKINEIKELLDFAVSISDINSRISERLISILYSQLVTALEVFLYEKFKQGIQSEKALDNFIKNYHWSQKYTIDQIYGNIKINGIKGLVDDEINKISFQNFEVCGVIYKAAFDIDILNFPDDIKRNITRVLRYRHALVHEDEIWDKGSFIKVDSKLLKADIDIVKEYIRLISRAFVETIGHASEIKMSRIKTEHLDDHTIDSCEECPLGVRENEEIIVCFEGAYDGLGFGIEKVHWNEPICGGLTFREAMCERKSLGENAMFDYIRCIFESDSGSNST